MHFDDQAHFMNGGLTLQNKGRTKRDFKWFKTKQGLGCSLSPSFERSLFSTSDAPSLHPAATEFVSPLGKEPTAADGTPA